MTEVQSKPERRRFTAAYKKKILVEVDRPPLSCTS